MGERSSTCKQAEGPLAAFYLGRALGQRGTSTTRPSRRSRRPRSPATPPSRCSSSGPASTACKGDLGEAKAILGKLEGHGQPQRRVPLPGWPASPRPRATAPAPSSAYERAVELDPAHTGALFQLGYANDLAGNDDEAIGYYEQCLKHPPVARAR